jgi:hypothetical protein
MNLSGHKYSVHSNTIYKGYFKINHKFKCKTYSYINLLEASKSENFCGLGLKIS